VTSMLTLGLVWLTVAVVVALPLGRLLRRADARQLGATMVRRVETEVLVSVAPDASAPPAAARCPAQPAAGPPPAERAVHPAHADPTISRTS
jgi:hypothetical protein